MLWASGPEIKVIISYLILSLQTWSPSSAVSGHDVLNYARLMPVHIAQMMLWHALMISAEGILSARGTARKTERAIGPVVRRCAEINALVTVNRNRHNSLFPEFFLVPIR